MEEMAEKDDDSVIIDVTPDAVSDGDEAKASTDGDNKPGAGQARATKSRGSWVFAIFIS